MKRCTQSGGLMRSAHGLRGVFAVSVVALSLGGCAGTGDKSLAGLSAPKPVGSVASATPKPFVPIDKNAAPVDRAIQYWSQAFAQNPGNEKAAVAYARNLRAKGEKQKALQVLQRASMANSKSKVIASEYARVAVDLGQIEFAQKLIARASDPSRPDWKLISAQGAALAKTGKHKEAQGYFLRALQLKPAHPPLLNNLALAYALNGDIEDAERLLRKAAARGQNIRKIRKNLALVLGVQGKFAESQTVAKAVYMTEGRARSNTEFLKRWVKASPQTAPAQNSDAYRDGRRGPWAEATVTPEAPQSLVPWAATTTADDAGGWQTDVAALN
ncbi:MAG: tetratricopeptide repeat protein [Pseudomonadota bacterium]